MASQLNYILQSTLMDKLYRRRNFLTLSGMQISLRLIQDGK